MTASIDLAVLLAIMLGCAWAGAGLATTFFQETMRGRGALLCLVVGAGTLVGFAVAAWPILVDGAPVPFPFRGHANPFGVSFAAGLAACIAAWLCDRVREVAAWLRCPAGE